MFLEEVKTEAEAPKTRKPMTANVFLMTIDEYFVIFEDE